MVSFKPNAPFDHAFGAQRGAHVVAAIDPSKATPAELADTARLPRGRVWPDQAPADDLIMEHAIARIETELRWHDAVLHRIGKLAADASTAGTAAAQAGRDRTR
jgi:hypothetical protein